MDINGVSIYHVNNLGEKKIILTAVTKDEAEEAFEEVKKLVPKYANTKIVWQHTYFNDKLVVGYIK
jgi:hypothetical protein